MSSTIPLVPIAFLVTQAVLDSSAACPIISAPRATGLGSPPTAKSKYGYSIGLHICPSHPTSFQVCLFDAKEVSLRDLLRGGAPDDAVLQVIGVAVRGKEEKHTGMEDIDVTTNRPMILIGG